jgi:hypothetical protein
MLAALAAVVALAWIFRPSDRAQPPGGNGPEQVKRLSDQACRELQTQRNLALAALENLAGTKRFHDLEEVLAQIESALPNDRFVLQNRAIGRVVALTELRGAASVEIDERQVFEAIDALIAADPSSHIPYSLLAHVGAKINDAGLVVTHATKATQLAPTDATAWFRLVKAGDLALEEDQRPAVREALARALAIEPENSHLLRLAIVQFAESQDPRAADALKALRAQSPLIEQVRRKVATDDPEELLDQALAAVERQDWRTAANLGRRFGNLIIAEDWVQSDLRQLEPHPISYALHEFSTPGCDPQPALPAKAATPRFVTEEPVPDTAGALDAAIADFNLDGDADVAVLTPTALRLLGSAGGQRWAALASTELNGPLYRLLLGDLDRDENKAKSAPLPAAGGGEPKPVDPPICHEADVDLVAYGPAGVQVFLNQLDAGGGQRVLARVAQGEAFEQIREVSTAALVDIDHEGDLDLVLATAGGMSVWINRGDATFEEVTGRSALPPKDRRVTSLVPVNWDHDCDLDLLVSGPDGLLGMLENMRHAAFRWRPFEGPKARIDAANWLLVLDADGNVSWDLAAGGQEAVTVTTTQSPEPNQVVHAGTAEVARAATKRALSADLDNDGHFDLLAWSSANATIIWGGPNGQFQAREKAAQGSAILGQLPQRLETCAAGDLDHDGDLDLVLAAGEGVFLLRNEGGNANHWLDLRLRTQSADKVARVNHLGIGSTVELRRQGYYRRQVAAGPVVHFGLGQLDAVDAARVVWTNCVPQHVVEPKRDQPVCEVQFPTTSCPFIYTWAGDRFEFLTDFLWAAPLGLQLAEGTPAPSRGWEYLLLPGERLQPKQGRYLLQMTEELQEAAYLDHVALLAVDHPEDVAVYSNEKVGPAELASFRVRTVRQRRLPAARDMRGRDATSIIAAADGNFYKGFEGNTRVGRTQTHFLEVDLGELNNPRQVTLYLTGWIYPASTSVNVGISQNAGNEPGKPPALWVPDARGEWHEARPFMGFPGGKTKTIAVDLDGLFPANDYRLRIVTNYEIYWDEAFFTVDEEPAEIQVATLLPVAANLHFRGFSERQTHAGQAPDTYDYQKVSTAPAWLPMSGLFTRYGDVRELLCAADDCQVIFGFGDELTLEFEALPPPRAGWKRDFLIYNVGWDKDCDMHVWHGQTVEPLPFRAMSSYPYPSTETFPLTPRHQDYLRKYQTRRLDRMQFWRSF